MTPVAYFVWFWGKDYAEILELKLDWVLKVKSGVLVLYNEGRKWEDVAKRKG